MLQSTASMLAAAPVVGRDRRHGQACLSCHLRLAEREVGGLVQQLRHGHGRRFSFPPGSPKRGATRACPLLPLSASLHAGSTLQLRIVKRFLT